MSTPPPPGAPYYPPPAPTPTNSGGCFKAAGITCAVLLVFGAVLLFFGVRAAKDAYVHHSGIFGQTMDLAASMGNGIKIQQAVVQYHKQNGHYPATLMTLVSDGLIDGKLLHSRLDTDPNPGHVSWLYTRPAEGAPGNTPLLTLHFHLNIPGAGATQQSQDNETVINLDGTTASNTSIQSRTRLGTP